VADGQRADLLDLDGTGRAQRGKHALHHGERRALHVGRVHEPVGELAPLEEHLGQHRALWRRVLAAERQHEVPGHVDVGHVHRLIGLVDGRHDHATAEARGDHALGIVELGLQRLGQPAQLLVDVGRQRAGLAGRGDLEGLGVPIHRRLRSRQLELAGFAVEIEVAGFRAIEVRCPVGAWLHRGGHGGRALRPSGPPCAGSDRAAGRVLRGRADLVVSAGRPAGG
jgi:hypothetical protein